IGLLSIISTAGADEPKPAALTPEEQKLAAEATKLNRDGVHLYEEGKPAEAATKLRQALEIRQGLYPEAKHPDGHPALAAGLGNLGVISRAMGHTEKAVACSQQSLEMCRKLYPASKYPDGHPALAASLGEQGIVLQAMGQAEKALGYYQQSF